MRELEGLSYREIGERLGMSRPSVESTLFRARRRLTEEYSELISGERCGRIQGIIATAAAGTLGTRDQRRMARHVSYCQPCRRQARLAGLDASVLAHTPVRAKIAAFLPLPAFLRRRWGGGGGDSLSGMASNHAPTVAQWSSAVSDPSAAGWVKAAATAATIAIAGVGAGAAVNGDAGIAKGFPGVEKLRNQSSESSTRSAQPAAAGPGRQVATKSTRTASRRAGSKRRGSGSVTKTTVTPVSSGTSSGGSSGSGGATAAVPSTSTSTSPVTAPSLPGSSEPSRPASGGTSTGTTSVSLDPVTDALPSVSDVTTDTGTKTGDVVGGAVDTVTGALTGG
jgi:hypothetical protein